MLIGIGLTIYFVSRNNNKIINGGGYQPIIINEDDLVECEDSTDSIKTHCNADGNWIKLEKYDADGNAQGYRIYEYDGSKRIKEEWYDYKGHLFQVGRYDEDSRRMKYEQYDADGNLLEW